MSTEEPKKENKSQPLDEKDISLLKRYGLGPYSEQLKITTDQNQEMLKKINGLCGIKESDTGLSLPSFWNLEADKVLFSE
jgi:26S proteasome regulatory subunit T1